MAKGPLGRYRQSRDCVDGSILEMDEARLDGLIRDLGFVGWQPASTLMIRIYKLCDGEDGKPDSRASVMSWLRSFGGPAVRRFILRELRKHRYDWLGDWAIIALVGGAALPRDALMLADLFEDTKAIDSTKESAVKGMSTVIGTMQMDGGKVPAGTLRRAREIASKALADPFPETRISGIWLATTVGGFQEKLHELAANDHAKGRGSTVAEEARMHLGIADKPSEKKKRRRARVAARFQGEAVGSQATDTGPEEA